GAGEYDRHGEDSLVRGTLFRPLCGAKRIDGGPAAQGGVREFAAKAGVSFGEGERERALRMMGCEICEAFTTVALAGSGERSGGQLPPVRFETGDVRISGRRGEGIGRAGVCVNLFHERLALDKEHE